MKRISILLALLLLVAAGVHERDRLIGEASEAAATEEATPEPTPTEEPSADETVGAIPSFDLNGDPELAGRFPDTVGGEPLKVQSFRGDIFMAGGGTDPSFQEFLDSVGADLEDVSVAFGGAMSGESLLSVGAFRVLGANEDDLRASSSPPARPGRHQRARADFGRRQGRLVRRRCDRREPGLLMFIYTKDDTLYFLTGTEEQVAEILAALP